ncbi:MAG: UDP-3-O-acyl-N-acetylglucosamine deacetylase [Lentisphaerae bacterium]|nr:UDP-3-O-acyl-N-acetylglucosamine deacetylase [Lentisphaerota bacterium]
MDDQAIGKVILGDADTIKASRAPWAAQAVDLEMRAPAKATAGTQETTLGGPVSVSGRGTFRGRAQRQLILEPSEAGGWFFDRRDLPGSLPIRVSVNDVWTTARNIVLCTGSPHNYMRMVEHIIALKVGMGLDHVKVSLDSGDPPLSDRSSLDLVDAVESVGIVPTAKHVRRFSVREPVTAGGANGSFLTFLPPEDGFDGLSVDCAVDFRSAIGKQRVVFDVTPEVFRHAAAARTNTTLGKVMYCATVGKIFADVRNLGYTTRNILIAGPRRYLNEPRLLQEGKSLEAVWHRAALDLLAAVALIDRGRFVGRIVSYKAGHTLDVLMIRELYRQELLIEMPRGEIE